MRLLLLGCPGGLLSNVGVWSLIGHRALSIGQGFLRVKDSLRLSFLQHTARSRLLVRRILCLWQFPIRHMFLLGVPLVDIVDGLLFLLQLVDLRSRFLLRVLEF